MCNKCIIEWSVQFEQVSFILLSTAHLLAAGIVESEFKSEFEKIDEEVTGSGQLSKGHRLDLLERVNPFTVVD